MSVGCLLLGEDPRLDGLRARLDARGVATARAGGSALSAAQEALYAVGKGKKHVCVAAAGESWAAALALAAQLSVERVLLAGPADRRAGFDRSAGRLKNYARRNLFFCVSDVLILEADDDPASARRVDRICRGLCNARVRRLPMAGKAWTNCKQSPMDAAVAFLEAGEFAISLAKSRELCIIYR